MARDVFGSGRSGDGDGGGASRADAGRQPILGYASGTLIDTPSGARPVEALCAGDRVETLDQGPMTVRWVHTELQALGGLGAAGRPVLIRPGAFGPGCPSRDLMVAAQHRILVGALGQLDGAFGGQCLAPARALARLPRVRPMMGLREMRWRHFALDSHEVVRANGCHSETLCLTAAAVRGLRPIPRRRLERAFAPGPVPLGTPARDVMNSAQVQSGLAAVALLPPAARAA